MAPNLSAGVTITLRTPEARAKVNAAILQAVTDTFEFDIQNRAKELSPVSEEWPSIPESRGEKRIDKGTNKRSIKADTETVEAGVQAVLYTQSGHGAYLELGTRKMPARPYLWPALNEFVGGIPKLARRLLRG